MMTQNMMSYMWGLGSGWGYMMMIFMWLTWLLGLVALILFIVWLVKQINK